MKTMRHLYIFIQLAWLAVAASRSNTFAGEYDSLLVGCCFVIFCPFHRVLILVDSWMLPVHFSICFAGRATCYRAFALAGFDIYDFDRYPEFFNDDSVFQLAQTGSYHGAAGIEEYVRFASPTSPYIEGLKSYDKSAKVKTARYVYS